MNCIYKLHARNVCFCLKLKEVTFECPTKCPFFTKGKPAHFQSALDKQYDIDCLFCTRKNVSRQSTIDSLMFYCTLYYQSQPFCAMCQFASYKTEPEKLDEEDSYLEK